jgi:DNA polymerase-3 subunit gamma/tau
VARPGARIPAKSLNCLNGPTPTPCKVDICLSISGDDVDVLGIDGASNRGIDEIAVRLGINIRPSRAVQGHIIDRSSMLTRRPSTPLKTLESRRSM